MHIRGQDVAATDCRDLPELRRLTGWRLQITHTDLELQAHCTTNTLPGWNYITINPPQEAAGLCKAAAGTRSFCSRGQLGAALSVQYNQRWHKKVGTA